MTRIKTIIILYINIYGINLKNQLFFAIKKLLLIPDTNYLEEINEIISKINIYDISLICKEHNINYYYEYLNLQKDKRHQNLPLTQKIHIIIQNNEFLKNKNNLENYKNKFLLDEKEKIPNKSFFSIEKNKFYNNFNEIFNLLKNKTDFTITTNSEDEELFQINFIDSNKFNDLESTINKLNNLSL